MRLPILFAGAVAMLVASPALAQQQKTELRPLPASLTSSVLERFSGEAAFRRYLRTLKREAKKRDLWWTGLHGPAQLASNQDVPCVDPEECPPEESGDVIVTAAKKQAPKSVTNNQEAGVDEGDIIKQIGQFLLVLQDGRIFVVDTKAREGLKLVDRANVYRDSDAGTWYDEMLVQDDHVIVTAYSYQEDASEVSVFRLGKTGKLVSEGVFLISSDDYYSSDNYATRIVGDNLVFYSPMSLQEIDLDEPIRWPIIRRWMPEEDREEAVQRGKRLFDATSIYRPVQPTADPSVHTISVCPIGPVGKGRSMDCRSTAIVGPAAREYYVTPTDVYLWLSPSWDEYQPDRYGRSTCNSWNRRAPAEAHPAGLYRIPVSGEDPTAIKTQGLPIDQFSFDASGGRFRALLGWLPIRCLEDVKSTDSDEDERQPIALRYFDIPLTALDSSPRLASRGAYTSLPSTGSDGIQNRFTDRYLVYAGPGTRYPRPPMEDDDDPPVPAIAVAVPVRAPARPVTFQIPHSVIRMEQLGGDVITTGYRDKAGLSLSVLDLSAAPRLVPPLLLRDRFESEGRSHAFNSAIEPDGHGLFGVPTVKRGDKEGWWWRSDASDVSFFTLDRNRQIGSLGSLDAAPEKERVHSDYQCEVSCTDWYGNSRPIFTDGRIFALAETEVIEGRIDGKRIVEIRRLKLTQPLEKDAKAPGP